MVEQKKEADAYQCCVHVYRVEHGECGVGDVRLPL